MFFSCESCADSRVSDADGAPGHDVKRSRDNASGDDTGAGYNIGADDGGPNDNHAAREHNNSPHCAAHDHDPHSTTNRYGEHSGSQSAHRTRPILLLDS